MRHERTRNKSYTTPIARFQASPLFLANADADVDADEGTDQG